MYTNTIHKRARSKCRSWILHGIKCCILKNFML